MQAGGRSGSVGRRYEELELYRLMPAETVPANVYEETTEHSGNGQDHLQQFMRLRLNVTMLTLTRRATERPTASNSWIVTRDHRLGRYIPLESHNLRSQNKYRKYVNMFHDSR